ncbi:MAG: hypothetical protein KUG80_08085 [Gammaproteobacteria bacterium]|nr:hypothetical protein [Gammaproteobacteria bacterium]
MTTRRPQKTKGVRVIDIILTRPMGGAESYGKVGTNRLQWTAPITFLLISRYIELNPVRAGMVVHPAEYPWASYQYNVRGKSIELIMPHFLYQGQAKTEKARQK